MSEAELRSVIEKRERLATLKAEQKALESQIEIEEGTIIGKLKKGFPVVGKLLAKLDTKEGRKTVSWKDEWANLVSKLGYDVTVEEAKLKAAVKPESKDVLDITDPAKAAPAAA